MDVEKDDTEVWTNDAFAISPYEVEKDEKLVPLRPPGPMDVEYEDIFGIVA